MDPSPAATWTQNIANIQSLPLSITELTFPFVFILFFLHQFLHRKIVSSINLHRSCSSLLYSLTRTNKTKSEIIR